MNSFRIFRSRFPERGTIHSRSQPLVVLTSNRTRELAEALRRRCVYHWIAYPDATREAAIIMLRAGDVAEATARAVAKAVGEIRAKPLAKPPGIAEAVEWANAATVLEKGGSPWPEAFRRALGVLIKDEEDMSFLNAASSTASSKGRWRDRRSPARCRVPSPDSQGISGASASRSPASRPSPSCKASTLLGPRSMEDIRQAALATLAPPPDRIAEFDALFRGFFYGEATVTVDAESDEDTRGQGRRRRRAGRRAAGTQAGGERRSRPPPWNSSAAAHSRATARH